MYRYSPSVYVEDFHIEHTAVINSDVQLTKPRGAFNISRYYSVKSNPANIPHTNYRTRIDPFNWWVSNPCDKLYVLNIANIFSDTSQR